MAFELKMPKLGESVTEGTIGKWLKQPGDKVNKYDLLVEVQTDKVNTEIPSPVAGTLKEVKVEEGQTVPIGTLLAVFDTADGEATAQPSAPAAPQRASQQPQPRLRLPRRRNPLNPAEPRPRRARAPPPGGGPRRLRGPRPYQLAPRRRHLKVRPPRPNPRRLPQRRRSAPISPMSGPLLR